MSCDEHRESRMPLYTLPTILLLAAVAFSFVGVGFVMPRGAPLSSPVASRVRWHSPTGWPWC